MKTLIRICLAAAGVALSAPLQAGQLDYDLLKNGPQLVKNLEIAEVQKLGVLRFQVQLPGKEPSFQVSRLNGELTNLVTHAILQGMPANAPTISLLNDINNRLADRKILDWNDNPKDRAKMFLQSYPPLWGKGFQMPDAFLTGTLKITEDANKRIKGNLELKLIKRANPAEMEAFMEIPVRVDAELLAETGRPLVMARKPSGKIIIDDKEEDVDAPEVKKVESLENLAGIKVRLVRAKVNEAGETEVVGEYKPKAPTDSLQPYKITDMNDSEYLMFELTNVAQKNLTVMVRVNGENLIQVDEVTTRKFYMKPGKTVLVRGVLANTTGQKDAANQWKPLRGVNATNAKKYSEELGDMAGFLEVEVYESSELEITSRHPIRARSKPEAAATATEVAKSSFAKSLTRQAKKPAPKSGILPRNAPAVMVIADETRIINTPGVTIRNFPNPTLLGAVTIKIEPEAEPETTDAQ